MATPGWRGGRADSWSGHYLQTAAVRTEDDPTAVVLDHSTRRAAAATLHATEQAAVAQGLADDVAAGEEPMSFEPLSPSIGSVIHGVDLANLTAGQADAIQAALIDRRVVFFRDQQHVTTAQLAEFARHFGESGLA